MTSISACLENAALRLRPCSDTAELDAQVLLARTLDLPRSWLAAHAEEQLEPGKTAALEGLIQRLEGGEPLPYVLGEWEFYSLPFTVTHDVLIPRPETELLVEQAIAWLRLRLAVEHESSTMEVLDVGTGSGCIAVALAVNVPGIHVLATDISAAALRVARINAEKNGVAERITFLEADLVPDELDGGSLLHDHRQSPLHPHFHAERSASLRARTDPGAGRRCGWAEPCPPPDPART